MSDSINRQAVLNTLDNMDKVLDEDRTVEKYKELLTECINELPSTENKGEWIKDHEVDDVAENAWYTVYRCSKCGCLVESWKQSNFCPNCGADMRGE